MTRHLIPTPPRASDGRPGEIVWDDEAGTVEGDGDDAAIEHITGIVQRGGGRLDTFQGGRSLAELARARGGPITIDPADGPVLLRLWTRPPLILDDVAGILILRDPFHDPRDFWRLLPWKWQQEPAALPHAGHPAGGGGDADAAPRGPRGRGLLTP